MQKNKILRIYFGIYTDNLTDPVDKIIRHNWMSIVAHVVPNGILSFRTAIDLRPISIEKGESVVFVTSTYYKLIKLPGLTINLIKGNNEQFLEQVIPELARCNIPRALLENLTSGRHTKYQQIKTIGIEGVEIFLAKKLRQRDEDAVNKIRDEAKKIAKLLAYDHEFNKLNKIISGLLATHPEDDFFEMNITPKSSEDLLSIIQNRHAYLMKERQEKRPGQFKVKLNKAGSTYFVLPNEVIDTLCQGFEIYNVLKDGIENVLFIRLLISEVHPFDDGNGRLARIMMNAELVKAELYKVFIPSVHRDSYLNGLRLASRDHEFCTYCKVIDQSQAYTANVSWLDYGEAREKLNVTMLI